MPYVNLIQEQRLALRDSAQRARSFFFVFVAVSILWVAVFGYLFIESSVSARQESKLRKQLKELQPVMAKIDENAKAAAALAPRLETLESAQLGTERWTRILEHLSLRTPEQMWLTNLKSNDRETTKPVAIGFVGMSPNQDEVGDMLLQLQECTDLENVTLKYTSERVQGTGKGIEFSIDAELTGSAEAKESTAKKKNEEQAKEGSA